MTHALHLVYEKAETLPPPRASVGVVCWLKDNLFSSPSNIVLTLAVIYILYAVLPPLVEWALLDAVWWAGSRQECWDRTDGACWAVVVTRFDQFVYGDYPVGERWRPNLAFVLLMRGAGSGPVRPCAGSFVVAVVLVGLPCDRLRAARWWVRS